MHSFYQPHRKIVGMDLLASAETRQPWLDDYFSIFHLRRVQEEQSASESATNIDQAGGEPGKHADIIGYIAYQV